MLPPQQRVVLELAYFKSMTQTEIARQLRLPLPIVQGTASKTLLRLRRALEAETSEPGSTVCQSRPTRQKLELWPRGCPQVIKLKGPVAMSRRARTPAAKTTTPACLAVGADHQRRERSAA